MSCVMRDVLPSEIKHKFSLNFTDISCQRNRNQQQLPVLVQRQVWTSLRSVQGCSFAGECETRVAKVSKCRSENDALEILFLVSIKSSQSTLKVTIDDTSEAVLFQLQYVVSTGKFTISVDGIYMTAKRSSLKHLSTQFKCPPGSVLNIKRAGCVACPVGTFYDKETLKCKACAPGSYQDREGQTSCLFYNGQGKRK
ncbi:uncharacterized protein LOC110054740 [Orbicella faveolata]|uniref:uncharacterized protein LOC110054740 n=1 Tax=Orbicella faveolata TaxID=48498 RepID=UPI0009E3C44E|nr:uncharacterized protein LOC110054740 [Orbicella faveolata]